MMCMGGPIDGADVRDNPREGAIVQIGVVKGYYKLGGDDVPYWRPAESVKGVAEAAVRAVYECRDGKLRHVRTHVGSQH